MEPTAPRLTGQLWKKRGGLGRHAKHPWQPRTFALSETGVLSYFDTPPPMTTTTPTAKKAEAPMTARSSLNLPRVAAFLDVPEEPPTDDAPTDHVMIIQHTQGQRWKLACETREVLDRWRYELQPFCSGHVGARRGRSQSPTPLRATYDSPKRTLRLGPPVSVKKKQQQQQQQHSPTAASPSPRRRGHFLGVGATGMAVVFTSLVFIHLAALLMSWALAGAVLLLLNLYILINVIKSHDEDRSLSETMVSLIVAPNRLPRFAVLSDAADSALVSTAAQLPRGGDAGDDVRVAAGSTGLAETPFTLEGGPPGTWSRCPASTFKIRQVGYLKSKLKAPSDKGMFEVVTVDLVDTAQREGHVVESFYDPPKMVAPSPDPEVPPLFLINAQIPSETGPLRVKLDADGHGYQVIIAMGLTDRARADLRNLKEGRSDLIAPDRLNALRLLKVYCTVAPTEPQLEPKERGRFKVVAQIRNIDDVNIPNFAKGYNGKPALIAKTGTLTRAPDGSYVELDINVHAFGYMARTGLQSIFRDFQDFILSVGFVLEGRRDEELPEVMRK